MGAGEALAMPRFILVGHTAAGDDLLALDATGCVLFLVATGAVDFLLTGDERFGTDGGLADAAAEALLVPLSGLIFHFFGSSAEDFSTTVTPGSELGIVAVSTVDLVGFGAELFVD